MFGERFDPAPVPHSATRWVGVAIVALLALRTSPAAAASTVRHGQVELRLEAHAASHNDAPNSIAEFSLAYTAGSRTRSRVTRVRL